MAQPTPETQPPFRVEVDAQPDTAVFRCFGRLMIESGSVLRREVEKHVKPGTRIVLDLTKVTHCDSMGLGAIIRLYVSAKSTGCSLELINMGPTIRKLFSMTNLLSLFEPAANSGRIP